MYRFIQTAIQRRTALGTTTVFASTRREYPYDEAVASHVWYRRPCCSRRVGTARGECRTASAHPCCGPEPTRNEQLGKAIVP